MSLMQPRNACGVWEHTPGTLALNVLAGEDPATGLIIWRRAMIGTMIKAALAPAILFMPLIAGLMLVYVVTTKTIGGQK